MYISSEGREKMMSAVYHLMFSIFFIVTVFGILYAEAISCPCSDEKLCQPIQRIGGNEIFIFSTSNNPNHWQKYDWNKITTIVVAGYDSPQLMCLAHKHNARIVYAVNYPRNEMTNKTAREIWTQTHLKKVIANFYDGVNIDYEDVIYKNEEDVRNGYTALVWETSMAFKTVSPYLQVTVDVAWSPTCIDERCYDYGVLALSCDFLFVMAYDERSQISGECIAWANSAFTMTKYGLRAYLSLGVSSKSLVLGVPWYGYSYPCTSLQDNTCYIKHVPFRNATCSDAAGRQYGYPYFMELKNHSSSGRLWDPVALSPYFNYVNVTEQKTYQMWYDDPESLNWKYLLQAEYNLRGVGMWEADDLNYEDTPEAIKQREEMWGALPTF